PGLDSLPSGLTYASAAGTGWSFMSSGQAVTATFAGAIAVGDSAKFTLTVDVAPAAFPSVTNAATASTSGDTDPSNDADADTTSIKGVPDLAVDKRHGATLVVGRNAVYEVVVTNIGTAVSTVTVAIRDTLP